LSSNCGSGLKDEKQPNLIMKVTVDVKNAQATEGTCGSDMVAEGMNEVHTAHATSTPVMETSKALE
jgi:hypothetical protein